MKLHSLKPARGSVKKKKRVGRGPGSGHGTTAGKGNKGQQSRSGYSSSNKEGGQMPLYRRVPKFGFINSLKEEVKVMNLQNIKFYIEKGFLTQTITKNDLISKKFIGKRDKLKLLGMGQAIKMDIEVDMISGSAKEKIEKVGGSVKLSKLGSHVTIPGVDASAIATEASSNDLLGMFDLFVGGAFKRASVFALGIMPYISASIIIQLLGVVSPFVQRLQREGEEGRKKINQYTRYGTVFVSIFQAWAVSVSLASPSLFGVSVIVDPGPLFTFTTVISLAAATLLTMWLGERITERGIGNGISLIIMIGILARFPQALFGEFQLVVSGSKNLIVEIVLIFIILLIIAGVVLITVGTRKIPVQYAKRVVGKKVFGGSTQYIPIRVNTAGVMPIIFAQSIIFIPATLVSFFPESSVMIKINEYLAYDSWTYALLFSFMIIFFTYFYTAIALNPKEIADNMQKQGGFIPGVRPGKGTVEYLDNILTRITLPGSISLAIIAILPTFLIKFGNVNASLAQFFGGTSLLIIVGVALDTLQQIESHLLMRHYDGFMKTGKRLKSRQQ
ncbi:hypothetical protein CHS0354_023754 [Potamilus streckersoni]|uniref:Large ribosomal subunit protein uL15m n=1 Tax=Potamilus streckersoni TaxID=2493646 RepID=A0AAE0RYS7_9BIVA|nr:hypothetical protein CHS0354_023754 [Potamilus streckersoni]